MSVLFAQEFGSTDANQEIHRKIPGGIMVVPLLLGALINTIASDLLRIGNFTQALFVDSAGALIALFLLCAGAQINLRNIGAALGKGATILAVKWWSAPALSWPTDPAHQRELPAPAFGVGAASFPSREALAACPARGDGCRSLREGA